MRQLYYIGLGIHKKMIAYYIKELDGRLVEQEIIDANRKAVGEWVKGLALIPPSPCATSINLKND